MCNESYERPEIKSLGTVAEITAQGGTIATDVPQGTPNTGPGSVTGDPS
jgi:hypothetical protein